MKVDERKQQQNLSDDKLFHSCNHKSKGGTRKIIKPGENFISVGTNKLYWKRPPKIRRRRDLFRTRSSVKRENAVINFKASQNQL